MPPPPAPITRTSLAMCVGTAAAAEVIMVFPS
jgi:hypothetical protein